MKIFRLNTQANVRKEFVMWLEAEAKPPACAWPAVGFNGYGSHVWFTRRNFNVKVARQSVFRLTQLFVVVNYAKRQNCRHDVCSVQLRASVSEAGGSVRIGYPHKQRNQKLQMTQLRFWLLRHTISVMSLFLH
jgi:hypothetical protein